MRSVYERIDEIRNEIYALVREVQLLPGADSSRLASYCHRELSPTFDSLAYTERISDRARDTIVDRQDRVIEDGHAAVGLSGPEDVSGRRLPKTS